ncbi:MAG TPA: dihydroneopterin aldolase [Acidimicrobiales bacterium]|nr:dihydroneopterin aldolase [Acidimicrobiales bacterium]
MAATDRIELRGLRVLGLVGILPEEHHRPQPIEVDLDVEADLAQAGASDKVEDTIDYSAICAIAERIISAERFDLLETLAHRLVEAVMADERARCVTVAVRKLRPPVPHHLDTCGVRISRTREQLG